MRVAVGTEKGAYLVDVDSGTVEGPLFSGWKVTAFGKTPNGMHLAGVGSNWFGAAVHRSPDLTQWEQVTESPTYGEARPLSEIWSFHTSDDGVYAGVADAGVFVSRDDGQTWSGIESFNEHPTRGEWQPGGGGLCAHGFLTSPGRMWVGVSAVGVFRTDDGGATWVPKNDGVGSTVSPEDAPRPEIGYCVHSLTQDPANPDRMWRQDHDGVFRSRDGGDTWERIEDGLPAPFGFVMRRDHDSGRLFVVPLHSDENRVPPGGVFRAYRSDDGGDSWKVSGTGWGDAPSFTSVLRGAVAADGEGTLVLGTTGGALWMTRDAGDTWTSLDPLFPRIGTVHLV